MLTTARKSVARTVAKPWRSVAFKLSGLTCLCVLGVIAFMAHQLLENTRQRLKAEMQVRAEFFARSAREAIFPKVDAFSLHFHVEEMLKEKAVTYAAVLGPNDMVLSHSNPMFIGAPLPPGVRGSHIEVPIMVGARRAGTALLGYDEHSIDEALRAQKRQILLLAATATAVAVLGTVLIVGWIMRPLPKLAAAAEEVGKGNFDVRVEWRSPDEIGILARAFNDMTIANAVLFATIRQEKEKLETIFHETREGIIWTDTRGKVLLINPSARALLGCQERAVDEIGDAARGFSAKPAFGELLGGSSRIVPFELQRAEPKLLILSGVADRLGQPEEPAGFLFVFHDATLEKRGETLSRNFLSLVSHKLRTPLAVALGYLEMVRKEGANLNDFQKTALKKIEDEDEKLRALVEKLITFSTVQSPENIVLERTQTTLLDAVDAALKALGPELERRDATVRWSREDLALLPDLNADPMLLREAVTSLVENAVKFNRSDDVRVDIAAEKRDGMVRLKVGDNGPGIPGEEQPKLFRKFYQIDEHFTGQIPGFGLGLAFVKNVVEAHGGRVGLSSAPGKGSEFWLEIPALRV